MLLQLDAIESSDKSLKALVDQGMGIISLAASFFTLFWFFILFIPHPLENRL
jgi:hypothetical protein